MNDLARSSGSGAVAPVAVTRGLRFGAGQVTISVFFQVTSLLLLPFMTNVLAIPSAIAATVIMLPKVASMFLDPLVGVASDRVPASLRRRRPLLLVGGLMTALVFPLLFHPFEALPASASAGYMFAAFAVANLALSCLTVSYLAAAADVTFDPRERTALTSWRVGAHMAGVLFGGLAPVTVAWLGGDRAAYTEMAVLLSGLCLAAVLANYTFIVGVARTTAAPRSAAFRDLLATLRHRSMFRTLVGIYGLKYLSNGIQYAATAYFVLFVLRGDLALLSALVVTMTTCALVSQPVWVRIVARVGEVRAFAAATAGIGVAFAGYLLLAPGDRAGAFVLMALQGVFAGGGALMSWSLFASAVQRYGDECGEHRPELLSGVWSAIEKSAFAIGVFVLGTLLQWLGLIPTRSLDVVQPASALLGIRIGMAALPAAGMALTLWLILRDLGAAGPTPMRVGEVGDPVPNSGIRSSRPP
jgi:GPH family glycoside/pentoside/hexuronide:cation symporter